MPAISWQPGEHVVIPFVRQTPGSISGYNMEVRVFKKFSSNPLSVLTIGHGVDIVDASIGTFNVVLSAAVTRLLYYGTFVFQLWKNNENDEQILYTTVITISEPL